MSASVKRTTRRPDPQPSQRREIVACVHLPAYLHRALMAAVERDGTTPRAYIDRAARAYLEAHGQRPLNLATQLQLDALADYLRPAPSAEPGDGWDGNIVEAVSVRMTRDVGADVDRAAEAAGMTRASYLRRALACALEDDAEAEAERLASAPDRWRALCDLLDIDDADAAAMPRRRVVATLRAEPAAMAMAAA